MRSPWWAAMTVGLATLALCFGWQWYRVAADSRALVAELTAARAQLAAQSRAAAAARFGQETVDRFQQQEFVDGARREVLEMQLVLVDKDVPVSAEQRQQLTKAFAKLERRLRDYRA